MSQAPVQCARVLRLGLNTQGRDFVVGDIHGAFDSLIQGMRKVCFDPKVDRLISVGDLIDRGPGSYRAAKFLAQPYVYAVRGNHEDMLMQLYAQGEPPEQVLQWAGRQNGFGWWLETSAEVRREILDAVRTLPLVIEVTTPRGIVGMVHAEVPQGMDWPSFIERIEAGCAETEEIALWGRSRLKEGDESGVFGVGRVFVGHTPQWSGLRRLGNVYAIDTGGVFAESKLAEVPGARLSFANISMQTTDLTALLESTEQLVDVRDGPTGEKSFGFYVR